MAVEVLELHHHGIRVGTAQIHLMGVDGTSKFAQGPDRDPSHPHVASSTRPGRAAAPRASARRWRACAEVGALAPAQQRVVDRAARLTRETIAPRAAQYDREGKNPVESWRDLWREGFLGASVPAAYGGLGLDMPTYIGVVRAIAQGCASTAMTLHMHSTVMRFVDALGTEAQKRRYFDEVVRHGKLFGSWGSEPAVSLSRTFTYSPRASASATRPCTSASRRPRSTSPSTTRASGSCVRTTSPSPRTRPQGA